MHVVQVYHRRLPVEGYGGAQRIAVWLCQGLAALGHRVTLLAPPGSRVPGVHVVEVPRDEAFAPGLDLRRHVSEPVDVMHYHAPVRHPPTLPWVYTLHGNMGGGEVAGPHAICVSEDHARRHGTRAFVHNGVRLDEYEFRATKGDHDLFLARLQRVKGWRLAVAAARTCRVRLVVAGGWRPSLSRYVKFVGEVGGARKRALLAEARCLWMPVQWDDPCPVNVLEALASGTPVLATPRGSLPELVGPDGGGLADTLDGLVALRHRLSDFSPAACRRRAERYFSHLRMARDYVRMYDHFLEHGTLPPGSRADAMDSPGVVRGD